VLQVILGSDRALARKALERVLASADPGGLDTDRIDAAASSFDAIFAAVTAVPFFGSHRVIVLSGMLAQAAGKGGRGAKGKSDSDLSKLVSAIPTTTTLVLFDPDLGELSATVRKQLPSGIEVSINDAPRGGALIELAGRMAKEVDSSLDSRTAQKLLDRLFPGYWPQAPQNRAFDKPPSIEQLESEIGKLALAAYPGAITAELIDDLVPQRSEERIFPLLDAVIGGNQREAIAELQNAYRAGEDASRMMNQVYQQIELSVGAVASGRPSDAQQAGRALGIASAYRMNRVTEAAQRSRMAPARQLRLSLENDRRMKTGRLRNPDEALVDLVVRATTQTENR
jgi:DNA polymerase III delta subunit